MDLLETCQYVADCLGDFLGSVYSDTSILWTALSELEDTLEEIEEEEK